MKTDGGRLRHLRAARNVTLKELAASAGCSYRHLQQVEAHCPGRERNVSVDLGYGIAAALTRLRPDMPAVTIDDFTVPDSAKRSAA